jgi:hypothetical protein
MGTRSNKDQGSLFAEKKTGKGRAIFVEALAILLAGFTWSMMLYVIGVICKGFRSWGNVKMDIVVR